MDFQDVKDNSGTIAAALAVIGVGLTAYLSGRAAIKAKDIPVPEDKKGRFLRLVSVYGGAIVSGLGTCALIATSDRLHHSRELALGSVASALAISDDYIRFERNCREEMGDERVDQIHARVRKEQQECLIDNRILVYEPYTDQYIWTTRETIAWAMLRLNEELIKKFDVRLNYLINLLHGNAKKQRGEEIGWNWENDVQSGQWSYYGGPWIDIQLELHNDGPRKCLWLFYNVEPETQRPEDMIYSEI